MKEQLRRLHDGLLCPLLWQFDLLAALVEDIGQTAGGKRLGRPNATGVIEPIVSMEES